MRLKPIFADCKHRQLWVVPLSSITEFAADAPSKGDDSQKHSVSYANCDNDSLIRQNQLINLPCSETAFALLLEFYQTYYAKKITSACPKASLMQKHLYVGRENSPISKSHQRCVDTLPKPWSDDAFVSFQSSHYASQLGHEFQTMIYNAVDGFHPNAFAALCSTVRHQGVIMLIVPSIEAWPFYDDADYQRLQFFGQKHSTQTDNIFSGKKKCFIARVVEFLVQYQHKYPHVVRFVHNVDSFKKHINELHLNNHGQEHQVDTSYQNVIIEQITDKVLQHFNHAEKKFNQRHLFFIRGERGFGKSATVGRLIAQMQNQLPDMNIIVTAKSKDTTATLYRHYHDEINSMAKSSNVTRNHKDISFFAPDYLIENIQKASSLDFIQPSSYCLVLEEAATMPLSILSTLIEHFPMVILLTTIDGYEGSGQGLALKLDEILSRSHAPIIREDYHLNQPMRWLKDDVVDQWLRSTFLLSNTLPLSAQCDHDESESELMTDTIDMDVTILTDCEKQQHQADSVLAQVYHLLKSAHYKTTPEDLRLLLDSEQIKVFYAFYNTMINDTKSIVVTSAALVVIEGHCDLVDMSADIQSGKRRPRGHFSPLFLAQKCQFMEALNARFGRVIRIATTPKYRRHGLAAKMVKAIEAYLQQHDIDYLTTSFSCSFESLHFWHQQNMQLINIGHKKEKSTGLVSAFCIKPCNSIHQNQTFFTMVARQQSLINTKQADKRLSGAIDTSLDALIIKCLNSAS